MTEEDRDRRMWEVLNVILPSDKKRPHKGSSDFIVPLTDERVNTVFPKSPKPANHGAAKKKS